jgi:hypothetical protein
MRTSPKTYPWAPALRVRSGKSYLRPVVGWQPGGLSYLPCK